MQTEKLPNLIKTPENKADEEESQTASDFARKRIPKSQKDKMMALIAAFEKSWKKRRAYDFKTFDKKKTPIVFATKSTSGRIIKSKTYQKTIIGFDKKK